MNDWLIRLRDGASALGIKLFESDEVKFARYLELLLERNMQVNLTAIIDPEEIAVKHFVDSLTVETVWHPCPGDRVIDIGTGAGFPGLPLAIRHPQVEVVLNDSVRKKVNFLQDVAEDLALLNVRPVWSRAETLGQDKEYRGRYNAVFARAVAHLSALVEYALPLLKRDGLLIAMKGPSGKQEVDESLRALSIIGGYVSEIRSFQLEGAGERQLIVVKKVKSTPEQFPREPGTAKKYPLYLDSSRGTS